MGFGTGHTGLNGMRLMRNMRDEGASAVEFALVLPLLLMLIFGGITAGLALDARQQMNHAAREGSRYGATLPDEANACGAATSWETCVRDRTVAASSGAINLARDGLCVSLILADGTTASNYYGTASGNAADPCYVETPVLSGARVQVEVQRDAQINAILFNPNITMTTQAVSLFEMED